MNRFVLLLAVALLAPLSLAAQTTATAPSGSSALGAEDPDAAFVSQAAEGGIAEVELSALAARNASSPDVRAFARRMADEHARNNDTLALIAAHENIAMPKELGADHARLLDELSALRGPDFDRAYVEAMAADHERMATLLSTSEATVHTAELRKYVRMTLPAVRAHLAMTEHLRY